LRARPEQLLGENRFSRANSRDIGTGLWLVGLFRTGLAPDRAPGRRFASSGPSRPGSARHVFRRRRRRRRRRRDRLRLRSTYDIIR